MTIGYHHATGLIGMISYDPVSSAADNALNSADRWIAFSITAPPAGDTPSKVMVYASGETGTVTTGLSCEIYSDNNGVPGTQVDASTGMTAACAAGTWLEFTGFDVALTGGTLYWVVIKNTTATPASNYPEIRSLTLMTPMYFANTGVNTMKTTTDAGSTWTAATKTSCNNIRIQWANGYSGFPAVTQAAASSSYGVYDKRELGAVFTTPSVGKMTVAGIAAIVSKTGTPPRAIRFRLYEGVTLIDTTYTTQVANVTTRSWIQGYFSTARVLKRNTTYRAVISVAYTGSGDGDTSNYFACFGFTIQDSNESRSLMPMRGWGGTYTTDSSAGPVVFSESGLTTFVPQIVLLLDSDAGEFAEPTQPAIEEVLQGVSYNDGSSTGTLVAGSGLVPDYPDEADVRAGVVYGSVDETTGTGTGTGTVWFEGTLALPAEADVRDTVGYGAGGTEFTGAMTTGSDWTAAEREQIRYRLGIDGDETAPSTNTPELGSIGSDWSDTEKSHIRYRLGIDGAEAAPTNTPVLGTLDANVVQWNGTNVATPDVAGIPDVNLTHINGVAASGAASVDANMISISGDTTAADNLELAYDGTGYAGGTVRQKVDLDTIKTQTITCAAGVTVLASVGTATTSTAQTGDTYALANGATGFTAIDTVVDAIKVKTDYLPSATAGAAGGVFIAGTNAPVTITGSGNALTLTSTGANGNGLAATGNGSGSGLYGVGGATGHGVYGYSNSGYGLYVASNFDNAMVVNSGNGIGLRIDGATQGMDVNGGSGADISANIEGTLDTVTTLTNMPDVPTVGEIRTELETNGGKLDVLYDDWLNGGRLDLLLDAVKAKTDNLPSVTAGTAGGVFIVGANVGGVSITNSGGDALLIQSTGGNGQGLSLVGNGTGSGLKASSGGTSGTAAIYAAGMVGMSLNAIAGNGMEVIGTAGDIVADITGNVSGSVGSVTAVGDKTGYKLASDGLDSISVNKPTGPAATFREMIVQTWMKWFNKSTLSATELKTYADDGTTVVTTQAVSDVAGTETQGPAT